MNVVSGANGIAFLTKLDGAGNYLWSRVWGDGSTNHGELSGVARGADDSLYVLGYFTGTLDLDPTAGTDNRAAPVGGGGFVVKLTKDGAYLWGRVMPTLPFYAISVAPDGSVYSAGLFRGTVNLDPTGGTDNRTASGDDAYVMKLASDGSYLWSHVITGPGKQWAIGVAAASNGVAVVGWFDGTATFDAAGTVSRTPAGSSDAFVTRLDASGAHQWTQAIGGATEEEGWRASSSAPRAT